MVTTATDVSVYVNWIVFRLVVSMGERIDRGFSHNTESSTLVVSLRLPAAARVRSQERSCGICGGQSGTVTGFLRVLRFPLPILIIPTAPHPPSSGAGTIGQIVADVPSGLGLTPSQ
jgi:hypothetical protein